MLTYDAIIQSLYDGEFEEISCGYSFSYLIPGKDEAGNPVDTMFLYSMNRATRTPSAPTAFLGIRGETGAIAYHRTQVADFSLSENAFELIDSPAPAPAPRPGNAPSMAEIKTLIKRYKELYPDIRRIAFSSLLTNTRLKALKEYFHVQRRLFGRQLAHYRQVSPEFYSWMLRQLGSRVSFLDQVQARKLRLSDVDGYLAMAGNEQEQQLLLGMTDGEFAFWKDHGFHSLRLILCGRVLKIDTSGFAAQGDPALIAARSYDPKSVGISRKHESRLEEVRAIARSLRQEYDLGLPVDLDDLAQQLGVRVERVELSQDIDGYVNLDWSEPCITLNKKAKRGYPARQNFTLAHEIGHVVIPWHTGTTACSTDNPTVLVDQKYLVDSQEQEAHVFASELLIPSDWLRKRMEKDESPEKLLESVRKKTKASVLACLYAMGNALPQGQVLCVTSTAMTGWKFFRGPGTPTWKNEAQAFALLEAEFGPPLEFTKGTYTIRIYKKVDCCVPV